ncbi:hypothetical protein OC845_004410, partial [Tilletia horrida]
PAADAAATWLCQTRGVSIFASGRRDSIQLVERTVSAAKRRNSNDSSSADILIRATGAHL